jgi:hypothetical protein
VFAFDLRATSADGLVVRVPSLSLQGVCGPGADGDDELSSLHVQPKSGGLVAVADDAGTVHLLELISSARAITGHLAAATSVESLSNATTANANVRSNEFPDAYEDDSLSDVFSQVFLQVSGQDIPEHAGVPGLAAALPNEGRAAAGRSLTAAASRVVSLVRGPTLFGGHGSVCTGAYFRPTTPRDLVSGALDATLCLWDLSKPRRPAWAAPVPSLADVYPDDDCGVPGGSATGAGAAANTTAQSFNPPLVQCVHTHPNGRYFAAGLGDASIAVHAWPGQGGSSSSSSSSGGGPRLVRRLVGGHAAAVAAVHFCAFDAGLLVSGGNDRKMCFWRLGPLFGADAPPTRASRPRGGGRGSSGKKGKGRAGSGGAAAASGGEARFSPVDVEVAVPARLAHRDKINWVSSEHHSSTVHLADVSPVISVFDVSRV